MISAGPRRAAPVTEGPAHSYGTVAAAIVALLALAISISAAGEARAEPAPTGPTVVPLHRHGKGYRTVTVRLGAERRELLFDTGGGNTVITPEVAEAIGCRPREGGVGLRMTGQRVPYRVCEGVTLGIAGGVVRHERLLVVDLQPFLPRGAPRVEGLLSLESFRGRRLTVDLGDDRLTVESDASFRERIAGMRPVHARVIGGATASGVIVRVAVRAGSRLAWLDLDSGNLDRVLLDVEVARAMGLNVPKRGFGFGSRLPGEGDPPRWEFDDLTVDVVGLEPRRAPGAATTLIQDGALSAGFMGGWIWTLDLQEGAVWASPRE